MAAHCEVCGGRVMPYRTYALWMKPTAQCGACGADVRLRRFWTMAGLGVGALGLFAGALVWLSIGSVTLVGGTIVAALFALDYGSYHVLLWEGDPGLASGDEVLLAKPDRERSGP